MGTKVHPIPMTHTNIGKVAIDLLKLSFFEEKGLRQKLQNVNMGESLNDEKYFFTRIPYDYFLYGFSVLKDGEKLFTLYFCFEKNKIELDNSFYIKVENRILYSETCWTAIESFIQTYTLRFRGITAVDLAIDTTTDSVSRIRQFMRSKHMTTIINGKAIKDRNKVLENVHIDYSTTLNKIKNPSLYITQKKAAKNRNRGITLCGYNKRKEIDASGKNYLMEFYGNPEKLYRLEIQLNNNDIKDYLYSNGLPLTLNVLKDESAIREMYFHHLSSLIRFRPPKARKAIDWEWILFAPQTQIKEILQRQDNITIYPTIATKTKAKKQSVKDTIENDDYEVNTTNEPEVEWSSAQTTFSNTTYEWETIDTIFHRKTNDKTYSEITNDSLPLPQQRLED